MSDRRTTKTKKALHQTFIALLKEKPLNKITIAELSHRADLGRGTFYLHYKDIYDLYQQLEDELYKELMLIFDKFSPCTSENILRLITSIATYISEQQELFLLLLQSNVNGNIFYKIRKLFYEKLLHDGCYEQSSEYEQLKHMFIVSGVVGVLEDWLTAGLDTPLNQVSTILYELLLKFDQS